jgi:twinkle protein
MNQIDYSILSDKKTSDLSFLSGRDNESQYLNDYHAGRIKEGLKTGYAKLDEHFRFIENHLVIVNGHNNVGKSTVIWYMALIANVLYNWKWLFYTPENNCEQVRRVLMEFKYGKNWGKFNKGEMEEAMDWCYENFFIIKNDDLHSVFDLLKMNEAIKAKHDFKGALIDPYNSLDINLNQVKCNSTDDYHNKAINYLRTTGKQMNISTYINTHAGTQALRRINEDNLPIAPGIGDVEYGAKWANRADEFITIHRYVQDQIRNNQTEIHIRKFKDYDLGGHPTFHDSPVILKMMNQGFWGFYDESNNCPLFPDKNNKNEAINYNAGFESIDLEEPKKDLPF